MADDYSEPAYNALSGWDPNPTTEEGWHELYEFREEQYLQRPYGAALQKLEHLFRAFDDAGKEIDQTRRILRYGAFVVDTDARALGGGKLVLDLDHEEAEDPTRQAQLTEAVSLWRRSELKSQLSSWFLMLCALGDRWVAAVRTSAVRPYRMRLVSYDPRLVTPTYDATKTRLERVVIRSPDGTIEQEYTATQVITRTGGNVTETWIHNLGVPPVAHLRCIPWGQPEHSLSAASGIERAAAVVDGLLTQGKAIGHRFANPTLVTFGFKLGAGSDVQRFGRSIDGAPVAGKAEYLTAGVSVIGDLLEEAREIDRHIRDTCPEFLFASDSAGESGEARNMRARAFEAKIEDMRGPIYAQLARITAIAVAAEQGRAFDAGLDDCLTITGPPVLPQSRKGELEALELAKPGMKRADYTRQLQRLGFVPSDADPEMYAIAVADEQAGRAADFMRGDPAHPGDPMHPETAAGHPPEPAGAQRPAASGTNT